MKESNHKCEFKEAGCVRAIRSTKQEWREVCSICKKERWRSINEKSGLVEYQYTLGL
jgi:hypothetical protein